MKVASIVLQVPILAVKRHSLGPALSHPVPTFWLYQELTIVTPGTVTDSAVTSLLFSYVVVNSFAWEVQYHCQVFPDALIVLESIHASFCHRKDKAFSKCFFDKISE